MGIVAGAVGLAVSAYSAYNQHEDAKDAQSAANARAAQQNALADDAKAEQQARQAKWDKLFGPMEKNIADYYTRLDASYVTTKGNEALAVSYQGYKTQVEEQLKSAGVDISSGVGAAAITRLASNFADERAKLYSTAEEKVIGMQQQALANAGRRPGNGSQQALANNQSVANMQADADRLGLQANQNMWNGIGDVARGAGALYGEYQNSQSAATGLYTPTVAERAVRNPSLYSQIPDNSLLF